MSDPVLDPFEAELRGLTPAKPPADLMVRLAAARPAPRPGCGDGWRSVFQFAAWLSRLRWLATATAATAAVAALLVWRSLEPGSAPDRHSAEAAGSPTLRPEAVEFDRQLVAAFDAVARLPGGEPVRFRCREWADAVVVRDSARGVQIEQRTPRLEIVPVRLETY